MAYLLDTHTLLWALSGDEYLSGKARALIVNLDNECYVSIASLWEITIKHSLGSLDLKMSLLDFFAIVERTGFTELPLSKEHLTVLNDLPFHHRDPFDRVIISQGIHEGLTIITKDRMIATYDIKVVW
ncbi:MAG: type II toxin-antitoxin system VapC family toxin [Flavipsychrobacter sp.]|nr:type II toxin-antitoxin system VapC family toxin [Flavipsychrobacter sp.]